MNGGGEDKGRTKWEGQKNRRERARARERERERMYKIIIIELFPDLSFK